MGETRAPPVDSSRQKGSSAKFPVFSVKHARLSQLIGQSKMGFRGTFLFKPIYIWTVLRPILPLLFFSLFFLFAASKQNTITIDLFSNIVCSRYTRVDAWRARRGRDACTLCVTDLNTRRDTSSRSFASRRHGRCRDRRAFIALDPKARKCRLRST